MVKSMFKWGDVAIVAGVILIIFLILYPAVKSSITGDEQLRCSPKESNRIHHKNGMSIIAPQGWVQTTDVENKLVLWSNRGRYANNICVYVVINYANNTIVSF